MPLGPKDVDVEARKQAGRDAAVADNATKKKIFGQTSAKVFPYTYHWIVGYNEQVDTNNAST